MSPLFMDAGYMTSSPESMSAEENHSSNAGSEREGEGQLVGNRGARRQEKNRDAARKSRRKQTERADELHEELQSLERSNSALQKEIASLKKEFHHYTTVLECHEASCTLRASAATSTSYLSVSSSGDCRTPSSSLQHSSSTQATAPSSSTSLTARLGLDCAESSHLTSSTSAPPATSLESSAQLFTPSSSVTNPSSAPFSTVPSPHSLFCKDPPSLTPPRMTKSMPVCTSLISSSVPSSYIRTPDQPSTIHESSPLSEKACSSTHTTLSSHAMVICQDIRSARRVVLILLPPDCALRWLTCYIYTLLQP
ncbi:basic leucine zipper transcriptional factor ATF-like 2 isoform X2 [Cheilinus undulatus]|uniref:basic leucine zipper transcriptional factor ATF-like 2 isoform X2 n=1 Tax=Cheilinus undulatus TaxID=241271 RepID=UPI001BD4C5F2|nr:basic leucine zipper transcriptional factor ATF-like 2 isoform X2 [Cheilinus undulatus]